MKSRSLRRRAPYELEIPISHSIAANGSDKFDITMGLNPLEPFESLYHIEVSLFFGSEWSNSLDCLVVLPAHDPTAAPGAASMSNRIPPSWQPADRAAIPPPAEVAAMLCADR